MSTTGSQTDPFQWGYIPPAQIEETARQALLSQEQAVLGDLIREQKGVCAACHFPAGRALRGYLPPGQAHAQWVGVCPLCLAALDLSRAPAGSTPVYLPEMRAPVFSRLQHTLFALAFSEDLDVADTAELYLETLRTRNTYLTHILNHSVLGAGVLCESYWTCSPQQQTASRRLLQDVRILINRDDFGEVLDHWRAHTYPGWAQGRGA